MSLFNFSHILSNANSPVFGGRTGVSPTLGVAPATGQSLQDEIDRFLIESALEASSSSSASGGSAQSSPSVLAGIEFRGDSLFGASPTSTNPFGLLFTFPLGAAQSMQPPVQTAPAFPSTQSSAFPISPSGSDSLSATQQNQLAPQKSTRGRKPKVLTAEEKEAHLQHRKEKNKEFAQVSRNRKRKHVEEMEATNATLSERVRVLEAQNASLMARVLALTYGADSVGSLLFNPPAPSLSTSSNEPKGLMSKTFENVQKYRSRFSTSFSFASLSPFSKPHYSQHLYPLLSFFRRRVFGDAASFTVAQ